MGNVVEFIPNYPYTLPEDWVDKSSPTIYEINATLHTLKNLYKEQVKKLENNLVDKEDGETRLRQIATNYQNIKSLLFQSRC